MGDIFASEIKSSGANVTVTANAARRIREIIEAERSHDLFLRLTISGGGCSGYQYGFALDDDLHEEDSVFERDGVKVVIDSVSLDLMDGSEIDFVEDLVGASFQVNNPVASSSCGCGTSFAV